MTPPEVSVLDVFTAAPPPRFRGTDVVFYEAGPGQEIVSSLSARRAVIAPRNTGALLASCRGFRPLADHAREICRTAGLAPSRAVAVQRRLEALADAGFLTSYAESLQRVTCTSGHDEPSRPIPRLGVPTSDRPLALARGLRSYMWNAVEFGRDLEVVVFDDSREASNRAANLATLGVLTRETGLRGAYAGPSERESFATVLARESGVPPSIVRFGLLNPGGHAISTGACRNGLLLDTAGDRVVCVDDDTICNLARRPGAVEGAAIQGPGDPTRFLFFASPEEARAAVEPTRVDYVGLYEAVLGRRLSGVLSDIVGRAPIDLDRLPSDLARQDDAGAVPVVGAVCGVVGDSGLGSSERYLFLTDPTCRRRLRDAPGGHRALFESRQVLRAAPVLTLAEEGPCLALGLGLDNRGLLPPFFPVMRNQDGIFSAVRHACLQPSLLAFLPWVVEHRPVGDRHVSFEQLLGNVGRFRLPDIVMRLVVEFTSSTRRGEPARQLDALGRHLMDIGRQSPADYVDRCRRLLLGLLDAQREFLDSSEDDGEPRTAAWRADIDAYRAAHRAARTADVVVPWDLLDRGRSAAEAVACGQRLIHSYGELLCAWPALVAAARERRGRGERAAHMPS